MRTIIQDLLSFKSGILFSQVNCQKVQGSGLALNIKNKWPIVYQEYCKMCDKYKNDFELLGKYQFIEVSPKLYVCNVFGQLNFGSRERDTDYSALNTAFRDISQEKDQLGKLDVYFPFLFGSDRAKGDWNIVSKMIDYYFPDAIICKLPKA